MAKDANKKAAAERARKVSRHRVRGDVVEVERRWRPEHLAAGHHEQEWGEHSHPKHPLLGDHDGPAGTIRVEHVEGEPVYDGLNRLVSGSITVGPEFKLTFPSGASVTVLCADTVRRYLAGEGGEGTGNPIT